ncbi:MAG: 4Fe-4S dicluster domain-containing protein [Acidimicrobiia bacterium]|nr:4Fe-4S dicluster domain-containing protein [Acidimicrobiia bacterium]
MDRRLLTPEGVRSLLAMLREDGFRIVAPSLVGGTVSLAEISDLDELAVGLALEVAPGRTRVVPSPAMFGSIGGPESLKRWQHPSQRVIWHGERGKNGFTGSAVVEESAGPVAFFGLRACDLAGARVLAKAIRRPLGEQDLVISVRCTSSAPTCFCTTMGTGPDVPEAAADLILTEVLEPKPRFVATAASERGAALLGRAASKPASAADAAAADALVAKVAADMPVAFAPEAARAALGTPSGIGWEDIGARCMACGNCTAVCPTCFCTTVVDRTDPAATVADRIMRWDSCYTPWFSEMHGGSVRSSISARYRQWVSHKMSWWWEQFGTAGCVGCGRCIVWCPVGIDIRKEVEAAIERSTAHV